MMGVDEGVPRSFLSLHAIEPAPRECSWHIGCSPLIGTEPGEGGHEIAGFVKKRVGAILDNERMQADRRSEGPLKGKPRQRANH
jgi:hypothetical protein